MNVPEELKYSKDHEWAGIEDGSARIGITDYAQGELGDIVFVDFKTAGTKVAKGDPVCTVESVKAVSDVYAPVSGTITEINALLEQTPEQVNQDCYGQGWMVMIRMEKEGEIDTLMNAQTYREYLSAEVKK
jgi:glycine cleavage system H protein